MTPRAREPVRQAPLVAAALRLRLSVAGLGIGALRWRGGLAGFAATACFVPVGLMLVAVADGVARTGSSVAPPLFWAGMFLLWMPIAIQIFGGAAPRGDRIGLLLLLGIALYVVKVLYSPRYFSGHDEFLHVRTAQDILETGDLATSNPVLPVSPLYPGLELVTAGLASVTGLSVHVTGLLVVGSARLVTILALFLLYETVGHSGRLASIAVLVYMTNPHFVFFEGSFSYESLALPLALVVLYAVARAQLSTRRSALNVLLVLLPLGAVVVTHHITSFILAIVLVLVAVCGLLVGKSRARAWNCEIALLAVCLVVSWLVFVAAPVLSYLEPPLTRGVGEVINLIGGAETSRKLFTGAAGQVTSPLDRGASLAFTAITVVALAYGMFRVLRRARSVFTVVFALTALAYPLSGLFRLTPIGSELGDRITPFVFVPVAFFVAAAFTAVAQRHPTPKRVVLLAATTAALLYGGLAIAAPAWLRLPGPYLVSADSRSVEPEGIRDATWARTFLGPQNRVLADRVNRLFMLTYGRQSPVTELSIGIDLAPVFFNRRLDDYTKRMLERGHVRYVVVDRRLSTALPQVGVYIDGREPGAGAHTTPIARAALTKFNASRRISRLLDSGHIAIYDVSRFAR